MTGTGHGRTALLVIGLVLLLVCTACDWTQYMGNAALNGVTLAETTITPANVSQLALDYTIALPTGNQALLSPVVSDGRLFAGTLGGDLVAASTGTIGCSGSPLVCQPLWTASVPGVSKASPPMVSNGTVYDVFSNGSGSGVLAAFDANGVTNCSGSPVTCQPLWTAPSNSFGGANIDGGTLFVADESQLEAFDAAGVAGCSGSPKVCAPLWTAAVDSQSVPSIADGKVYVPSLPGSGVLSVFDEAGSTNCTGSPKVCQPEFQVPIPTGSTGSVDVANGVGYVAASTQNQLGQSQLVAFDATGVTGCSGSPVVCQPLWTAPLSARSWYATPAVTGGRVYVSSSLGGNGFVDEFDAAGVNGCSGTPVVCTTLERLRAPSGSDLDGGSPVVSDGLLIEKNGVYPATDTTSCTPAPAINCAPLWTAPQMDPEYSGSVLADGTLFIPGPGSATINAYRIPAT